MFFPLSRLLKGIQLNLVAFAFEAIMALAIGHAFGCYNPNQWADYLGLTPQQIYAQISTWSRYRLQQVLLKMMVHQAAEQIKAVQSKSAATQSRANITQERG